MKKVKFLSLVLASAMIFTACTSSGEPGKNGKNTSTGEVIKGGFIGKNITPEQANIAYNSDLKILKDGTIVYYTELMEEKVISTDKGQNWSRENTDIKVNTSSEDNSQYVGAISEDGVTYLWWEDAYGIDVDGNENKTSEWQLFKIDESGEKTEVNIPEIDTIKETYKDFQGKVYPIGGGKLYITGTFDNQYDDYGKGYSMMMEEGQKYNAVYDAATLQKLYDLPTEIAEESYYMGIESDDENIYVFKEEYEYNENKGGESEEKQTVTVKIYDIENGKHVKDIPVDMGEESSNYGKTFNATGGKLYFANSKGIFNIDKESGKITNVLDGSRLAFANPVYYTKKIFALPDNEFIVVFYAQDSQEIWHFSYDENFEIDPNASITVLSLYEDWDVKYMAAKFLEDNPNATVNVEFMISSGKSEYTVQSVQDAIKELNTRLLTGNAPDVLILDGLPAEKYAEQGILMNLDGEVDTSGVYSNLIEQVKVKEGLYFIPLGIKFPVAWGEQENLDNIKTYDSFISEISKSPVYNSWDYYSQFEKNEEFVPKALSNDEKYIFTTYGFQNIYNFFWTVNEPAIIENNKLNEENLKKFLELCKVSAEKNSLFDDRNYEFVNGSGEGDYTYDPDEYEQYDILGRYSYNEISSGDYGQGLTKVKFTEISAHYNIIEGLEILNYYREDNNLDEKQTAKKDTKVMNFPSISEGVWYPKEMIAITDESKNKEMALKFVQQGLSKPVQKKLGEGLPIIKGIIEEIFSERDKDMYEELIKGKVDVNAIVDELCMSLKTPLITDNIVRTMAWEGTLAYCKGNISIDEAVAKIKSATNIYISERAQ